MDTIVICSLVSSSEKQYDFGDEFIKPSSQ